MTNPKSVAGVFCGFLTAIILLFCVAHAQEKGTITVSPWNIGTLAFFSDQELELFLKVLDETPSLAAEAVPRSSTMGFYSLQHPEWPPFPADIRGLPVWDFGEGFFLMSDLEVDYSQKLRGGGMMKLDGPPSPGGGGGGGEGGTNYFGSGGYVWTTNDLWLEITGVSSNRTVSYLVIHPPWDETNGVWDLFGTTNLVQWVPGLNLTNWIWVLRTDMWQTNLAVTNFSTTDQAYFRLGTMLDSDGDGLTDAYENLVSHTDPNNPDTDGDGLSDFGELLIGMNPLLNESIQSGNRLNYIYDGAGQLQSVSGKRAETVGADAQGNLLQNSQ